MAKGLTERCHCITRGSSQLKRLRSWRNVSFLLYRIFRPVERREPYITVSWWTPSSLLHAEKTALEWSFSVRYRSGEIVLPPCCIYLGYLNHIMGLAHSSFKFQLTFLIRESNGRPLSLWSHVAETSFTDVASVSVLPEKKFSWGRRDRHQIAGVCLRHYSIRLTPECDLGFEISGVTSSYALVV